MPVPGCHEHTDTRFCNPAKSDNTLILSLKSCKHPANPYYSISLFRELEKKEGHLYYVQKGFRDTDIVQYIIN